MTFHLTNLVRLGKSNKQCKINNNFAHFQANISLHAIALNKVAAT